MGERAYLWAGDSIGRITIGENCRLGPEVFVTASDYGRMPGQHIAEQARDERDITIGDDVWLGARVFVGTGVTIGDGCVVSADSVVTRDLPAGSIAAGVPARVVRRREDYAQAESAPDTARPRSRGRPRRGRGQGRAAGGLSRRPLGPDRHLPVPRRRARLPGLARRAAARRSRSR